jgi:hypothetical protein
MSQGGAQVPTDTRGGALKRLRWAPAPPDGLKISIFIKELCYFII